MKVLTEKEFKKLEIEAKKLVDKLIEKDYRKYWDDKGDGYIIANWYIGGPYAFREDDVHEVLLLPLYNYKDYDNEKEVLYEIKKCYMGISKANILEYNFKIIDENQIELYPQDCDPDMIRYWTERLICENYPTNNSYIKYKYDDEEDEPQEYLIYITDVVEVMLSNARAGYSFDESAIEEAIEACPWYEI